MDKANEVGLVLVQGMVAVALAVAVVQALASSAGEQFSAWRWLACQLRQAGHSPRKQAMGGFRCEDCGMAGGSLDEFGFASEDNYMSEGWRESKAHPARTPTSTSPHSHPNQ